MTPASLTYEQARSEIGDRMAAEALDARLSPQGRMRLLDYGRQTGRSVLLFHGFTNCPQQMAALAQQFFDLGFNVIVPRLPGHGMADRMTTALTEFTDERIAQASDEAFAWAQGLGQEVDVMGISLGGVMAAWLAQNRDVHVAMAMSPFFALPGIPGFASDWAGAVMRRFSHFLWWDPRVKEKCLPDHAYPRYPARALGACLQFGSRVRSAAKAKPPKALRTIVVTNTREPACNNAVTHALVRSWLANAAAGTVEAEAFSDVGLRHDIIELDTYPEARTVVYPRVLSLMETAKAEA